MATCGLCGGGLVVETSSRLHGRVAEYVCHRHRHNGTCVNWLRMPVAEMNEAVLQAVEQHVFTPEAIEQVIALTERDELRERQDALRLEHKDVERRIARLTSVLETDEGAGVASLVAKLRVLEQRKLAINGELKMLQPVPRLPQHEVTARLDEWRRLLRASTTQGRAVLQRVIDGRITFTPTEAVVCQGDKVSLGQPGYEFQAPTRFDKLFSGIEQGGPLQSLVALLTKRQAERDALRTDLASVETLQHIAVDRERIERDVQAEVAHWRALVTGSVTDGRQLLREALEGPLVFQREGAVYKFTAPVATARLIAGVVGVGGQHDVASPTGTGRLWYWPIDREVRLAA